MAPDQAENLKAMPNLVVTRGATMRIGFLILDARGTSSADSPMKHLKVRQAINYAINRDGLASQLVGGESKPLQVACYPGQSTTTTRPRPKRCLPKPVTRTASRPKSSLIGTGTTWKQSSATCAPWASTPSCVT